MPAAKKTDKPTRRATKSKEPTNEQLIDGIEFADNSPQDEPSDLGVQAASGIDNLERVEAQQREAMTAVERQRVEAERQGIPYIPELLGQKPRPPTPEERKEIEGRKRWWQVLEQAEIRRGAAKYTMVAGKVFDNNQYDVESLLRQGVKLKEVDPKSIYVRPDF